MRRILPQRPKAAAGKSRVPPDSVPWLSTSNKSNRQRHVEVTSLSDKRIISSKNTPPPSEAHRSPCTNISDDSGDFPGDSHSLPDLDDIFEDAVDSHPDRIRSPKTRGSVSGLKRPQESSPTPKRPAKAPFMERCLPSDMSGQNKDGRASSSRQYAEPCLSSDSLNLDFDFDAQNSSEVFGASPSFHQEGQGVSASRSATSDTSHALNETFDQLDAFLMGDAPSSVRHTPELDRVEDMDPENDISFQRTKATHLEEGQALSPKTPDFTKSKRTGGVNMLPRLMSQGQSTSTRKRFSLTTSVAAKDTKPPGGVSATPSFDGGSGGYNPGQYDCPAVAIPASTAEFKARLRGKCIEPG